MTHRGPFQPLLFCDSVILCGCQVLCAGSSLLLLLPVQLPSPVLFHLQHFGEEGNEEARTVCSAEAGDIRHPQNGLMTFCGVFCVSFLVKLFFCFLTVNEQWADILADSFKELQQSRKTWFPAKKNPN